MKIIISTEKKYSFEYDDLLIQLFQKDMELFSAFGKYADEWENRMDDIIVQYTREDEEFKTVTTSHSDEPWEDVLEFVELWNSEENNKIEIIKL